MGCPRNRNWVKMSFFIALKEVHNVTFSQGQKVPYRLAWGPLPSFFSVYSVFVRTLAPYLYSLNLWIFAFEPQAATKSTSSVENRFFDVFLCYNLRRNIACLCGNKRHTGIRSIV